MRGSGVRGGAGGGWGGGGEGGGECFNNMHLRVRFSSIVPFDWFRKLSLSVRADASLCPTHSSQWLHQTRQQTEMITADYC